MARQGKARTTRQERERTLPDYPMTEEEIASALGVSRRRVCQLLASGMSKVRRKLAYDRERGDI